MGKTCTREAFLMGARIITMKEQTRNIIFTFLFIFLNNLILFCDLPNNSINASQNPQKEMPIGIIKNMKNLPPKRIKILVEASQINKDNIKNLFSLEVTDFFLEINKNNKPIMPPYNT
jgi:hypothetical protein